MARESIFPLPKNELFYWNQEEGVLKPLVSDNGVLTVKPDGTIQVNIVGTDIMQPIDIQSHYQQTIQTHTGAMVAPNGTSLSAVWVDTSGFDRIGVTLLNDANASSRLHIHWSNDGITTHGFDVDICPASTYRQRAGETTAKARYMKIEVQNADTTTPHTMSAWAYLKA